MPNERDFKDKYNGKFLGIFLLGDLGNSKAMWMMLNSEVF